MGYAWAFLGLCLDAPWFLHQLYNIYPIGGSTESVLGHSGGEEVDGVGFYPRLFP